MYTYILLLYLYTYDIELFLNGWTNFASIFEWVHSGRKSFKLIFHCISQLIIKLLIFRIIGKHAHQIIKGTPTDVEQLVKIKKQIEQSLNHTRRVILKFYRVTECTRITAMLLTPI